MFKIRNKIFISLFIFGLVLGILSPNMIIIRPEDKVEIIDNHSSIISDEYPPFESPPSNASTTASGSIQIDGTNIHWRYFFPNTSILQPPNVEFSFDLWWEHQKEDHVISFGLSEGEGGSSVIQNYGMQNTNEKAELTPDHEFVKYIIWSNSTYFFVNHSWSLLGNPLINEECLFFSLGIISDTYHPILNYTIIRDFLSPIIDRIVHPGFNISENALYLNWTSMVFHFNATDRSNITSASLIATYVNQSTHISEEMILWNSSEIANGELTEVVIRQDIVEEYMDKSGYSESDPQSISTKLILTDKYELTTTYELTLYIDRPDNITTTTTESILLNNLIQILGIVSFVGITIAGEGIFYLKRIQH